MLAKRSWVTRAAIVHEPPTFDKATSTRDNRPLVNTHEINIDGEKIIGVEVALPGAPLVVAYGLSGFVMCGYLSIEAADKLNVAAAVVRGVSTVDDLLRAPIQAVSKAGAEKGVTLSMTGAQALNKFV